MKAAWFRIEGITDALFESLRMHMLAQAFAQESVKGFQLEEARLTYLMGSYIEKTEFIEHVADPFGGTTSVTRLRYEVTRFRINRQFPELEIVDYPRSVRGLLSEISIGLKHDVSIERCDASVHSWLDALSEHFKSIVVQKFVVSGVPIAAGVAAQIIFHGDKDIRNDAVNFLGNRGGVLGKACFTVTTATGQVFCELSKHGRASFHAQEDEIMSAFRSALAALPTND